MLSSGYGTLSAWETGLEPAESPGEDEDGREGREKHHWPSNFQENAETTGIGCQQNISNEPTLRVEEPNPLVYQQRTSGYVWVICNTHPTEHLKMPKYLQIVKSLKKYLNLSSHHGLFC